MAYLLYGGKCGCGVTHYRIAGDATRGELRALRERLLRVDVILHYTDDEHACIKCICGVVLKVVDGRELQVVTGSDK